MASCTTSRPRNSRYSNPSATREDTKWTPSPTTASTPIQPKQRPRLSWRLREAPRARVAFLDPALLPPGEEDVYATVYEPDVLLVTPQDSVDIDTMIVELGKAAKAFGWTVTKEELEDPIPTVQPGARPSPTSEADQGASSRAAVRSPRSRAGRPRHDGATNTVRARIAVDPGSIRRHPVLRPDAWRLLRAARKANIQGVSLNHVMSVDSAGVNPFTGNPFTGNPFTGNPFTGNPFTGNPFTGNPAGGLAGYAYPGFGGRQPVYYAGPALIATTTKPTADRPVVAVLDTGCGRAPLVHPGNDHRSGRASTAETRSGWSTPSPIPRSSLRSETRSTD